MATVTLSPNGTRLNSNMAITGAATIEAALTDASDASYVNAAVLGGFCQVELSSTSLPAGARVRQLQVTVRAAANNGSFVPARAIATLFRSDGTALGISADRSDLTTGIVTFSGAPGALELTQAEIDGLYLAIDPFQVISSFAPFASRIHEASVALVYAEVPTCAVSAPTGTVTTTSQPPIVFTHTPGSDGGGQVRYQVRVFTAAQYGIAGFDPQTSTATWESGEVVSSASTVIPARLANGTTYRAYVRTAQFVSGSPHWSTWAFSQFSTSWTNPTIQAISATPDATLGRHRLVVDRNTGTPNWTRLFVERSIDSGVTWVPVRGLTAGILPPGNQWIGYDYEAPNGVACTYRARSDAGTLTGPWLSSSPATWSSSDIWVKDVRNPARSRKVVVSRMPEQTFDIVQQVFRAAGRVDPVVVSDVRQMASASLQVECDDLTETLAVLDLIGSGVVLWQPPVGLGYNQAYIVAGRVGRSNSSPEISTGWAYLDVDFVEVTAPADDGVLLSVGTTYADMAATYATYQAAINTGRTYGSFI